MAAGVVETVDDLADRAALASDAALAIDLPAAWHGADSDDSAPSRRPRSAL